MQHLIHKYKDYIGGGLMFLLGLGAITQGWHYQVGTLTAMGPGFFPAAVGAVLALSGIAIAIAGRKAAAQGARDASPPLPAEWRGWTCILLGLVAFLVFGKYGGLLPASIATTFISALGDRQNTVKSALLLSIIVGIICVVVFWWGLKVQFPLFRWGAA